MSNYESLLKVMKELEKDHSFIFLPNFTCCRNCAYHELHGGEGVAPNPDFSSYEYYATFNEQMGDHGADTGQLEIIIQTFDSEQYGLEFRELVVQKFIDAGFEEGHWDSKIVPEVGVLRSDLGIYVFGDFPELMSVSEDDEDYDDE